MKKIITILAAILVVMVSAEAKSSRQRMMEKEVTKELTKVSFAHFKEYQTVTLGQEIDKWTRVADFLIGWDESFVDAAAEMLVTPGLAISQSDIETWGKDCRKRLDYHTALLNHLNKVRTDYDCDKVSFTICQLTYVGTDRDGNKVHDHCYGRFNTAGEMVAFRLNDTSDWEVTGYFWSIPGIEDVWKIPARWRHDLINVNF